ncbi:MAG: hypothetical protein GW802_26510 [Armatimonadetes bacterium]|nr:hypothetical protein [Armatimonadota bacterium]
MHRRRTQSGQVRWVVPIGATLLICLGGLTWVLRVGRGVTTSPVADPMPANRTPPPDPELEALKSQLDRELALPTVTEPVPLAVLKAHDTEFAGRRGMQVSKQLAETEALIERLRVDSELLPGLRQEVAALEREQRSLARLTAYRSEGGRERAHAEYKETRIEVFEAQRARETPATTETTPSAAADSRRQAQQLRELKRFDREYASAYAEALETELAVAQGLRRQVDFRDPLFQLLNAEIKTVRDAHTVVERTTHYRDLHDRRGVVQSWQTALTGMFTAQLDRLEEAHRRLGTDSPWYWDSDRLVATLAASVGKPAGVADETTPEAAFNSLKDRLVGERATVEGKRRYCLAVGRAERDRDNAGEHNRCAVALQHLLEVLDAGTGQSPG